MTIPKLKMDDLEARIAIIQGGMSVGISFSGLASAVAEEGGIGVIGAAGIGIFEPDLLTNYKEANERALRREIQTCKKNTDGIIGVNIMMALSDYDSLINASIEENVDIVFIGAGLFLRAPDTLDMEMVKKARTKIVPIVSSAKGAKVMFNYWARFYDHVPDAVVVEGPLAGGHLGFTLEDLNDPEITLESIAPEVISIIEPFRERYGKDIPVIAGGGIWTGEDIRRMMDMGASGVQMGTRFVATHECDASMSFKELYLNCTKDDITIIKSPVGMPGRAIRNSFIDEVSSGVKKPFTCPWKCLRTCDFENTPYCIAMALSNSKRGNLDQGFAFAGANAYRVDRIIHVKELMETLVREYDEADH